MTERTVMVQWDYHLRPMELEKLKAAWTLLQDAPPGKEAARTMWLAKELQTRPEFEDMEGSRYAVAVVRKLWKPNDL